MDRKEDLILSNIEELVEEEKSLYSNENRYWEYGKEVNVDRGRENQWKTPGKAKGD